MNRTHYVYRDGRVVNGPYTENDAFEKLLKSQPQSVWYATQYEGWSIEAGRFGVMCDRIGDLSPMVVDNDFPTGWKETGRVRVVSRGFDIHESLRLARLLETIDRVDDRLEPWPAVSDRENPASMRRLAGQLFRHRADHHGDWSVDARMSCGGCALHGWYNPADPEQSEWIETGPNYSGWHRVYIEAGRPIPRMLADGRPVRWSTDFLDALDLDQSDNHRYSKALARSVVTFGVDGGRRLDVTA